MIWQSILRWAQRILMVLDEAECSRFVYAAMSRPASEVSRA